VWVGPAGHEDKIAAIGIRVAKGVTMHGFALNCSNSLEPYDHIIACGIRDAGVTTMSRVLGRTIDPSELIDPITSAFRRMPSLNPASSATVSSSPTNLDTVRTNA
jgi:lipoyl(octanoyl) transferase